MIIQNHPMKPIQQLRRLSLVQLIDPLGETAQRKDTLPPSDGVGPHDGVHRRKILADVEGAAAGLLVDEDVLRVVGHGAVEPVADEGGREALEEFLVRAGEAVVDLVARGPEGVAAAVGGELGQAEGGVVGGADFELDVAVPFGRVVATFVSGGRVFST